LMFRMIFGVLDSHSAYSQLLHWPWQALFKPDTEHKHY